MISSRPLRTIVALLLSLTGSAQAFASPSAERVGTTRMEIVVPDRGRTISVTLWYPVGSGGVPTEVGTNALFVGTPALRDASVEPGRHALIVLSHGSGGHAANLGWLANRLVARGFVVAAPDHPGTTSGDSRPADTVKIWERPADLTAVATGLLTDPAWTAALDPARIGAVGFSLGGFSALALAGARADAKAYADYCAVDRGPVSDCAWYARGGVDLRRLDAARFDGSFADERVRTVVAVDPALAQALQPQSLRDIRSSVHFINLGRSGETWIGVEAEALVPLVPNATLERIPDATHFSFLGLCRPEGAEILKAEGETDPLCDEIGDRDRAALHDDIARRIGEALERDLD